MGWWDGRLGGEGPCRAMGMTDTKDEPGACLVKLCEEEGRTRASERAERYKQVCACLLSWPAEDFRLQIFEISLALLLCTRWLPNV